MGGRHRANAFNSIVQLEHEHGIPRNPFINAGAIVIADILLADQTPKEAIAGILAFMRRVTGDDTVTIDKDVAASERETGDRNRALANFMKA